MLLAENLRLLDYSEGEQRVDTLHLEHFTLEIVYSDFSFKAVPCVSFQEKGSLLSYTHKPKRFVLKARCAARLRASAAHPPEHFKCEML